MKKNEKNKDKTLHEKQNINKKVSSKKKITKIESFSNEKNDYNFKNQGGKKKENNNDKIIDDKLIENLKEEDEENKILLKKLKSFKKINRDFMKEIEQEKIIKERYITRRNLLERKKKEKYDIMVKNIKDPRCIKRTNKLEKKLYNNIEKYENDKINFKRKLSLKIENKPQNKYIEFQNENKIKQKEKWEKKHLLKLENDKVQLLVKNNFKSSKDDINIKNKSNNLFFKEENRLNLFPEKIINEENKIERPKSSAKEKLKLGISQIPRINQNLNIGAHEQLNNILKNEKDDKRKLEKLLIFKKKYKYFDISSYIQTSKMSEIQNAKIVRVKNEDICILNQNPNFNLNFEIGKNDGNDIIIYRNYLQSCKYNNNEHIQAYLLKAKNDLEVWTMVNERDDYGRNGLMYLLIHNNINMIKLTLLSGVTLDDRTDIFGRNLIHYCCTNNVDYEMLDIICHCFEFKNFANLCKYVDKCIPIDNNNIEKDDIYTVEYQIQCEEKIKKFDNLIQNKEKILIEKGIIRLNEEEDYYNYSYNKNKEKNCLIEVKREIKDPYENIYKKIINTSNVVNCPDIEGNYPIHYLVKNDNIINFKKIEILVYFHAKVDELNNENKKPIELTNSEKIRQFLLNQEKNINSKTNLYGFLKTNINNINNNKSINYNFNNSDLISKLNVPTLSINIEDIQFYTPEKINSFYIGVAKNNYLILSVIQENFELFKFLLKEKKAKADYINQNGWSILNFIILKKLWIFFSFLFDFPLPDQCDTTEKIYKELKRIRIYNKNIFIKNSKNELTYTGAALFVINNMTKKNNNLLSLCIDELNDFFLLKSLLILYENYINYFIINQKKDLLNNKEKYKEEQDIIYHSFISNVLNNQYGKNKETLLIKSIKKNNLNMFKFLLNGIKFNDRKIDLDIHKSDFYGQNVLHYAVLLKQKETILFLIKYDADFNKLKKGKNLKGKTPSDLDKSKSFENELCSIWEASKNNDINKLKELIKELKYYDINEQTYFKGNTALHIAVQNQSDKAVLFLILNGIDKDIKNKSGLTALETIEEINIGDKKWVSKVKRILDGKIKNYSDLNYCNSDKLVKNEDDIRFNEKINIVNGNIKKKYEDKKEGSLSKLNLGISMNSRLRELLSILKKIVKKNDIDLDSKIKEFDKNDSGKIKINNFVNIFSFLDNKNFNSDDISFLQSFLITEGEYIKYNELILLLKT